MGFDWEAFYSNANYDRHIYLEGPTMVDNLETFLERFGPFDSLASVGCGPAVVLFELADRFPNCEFVGYDISETLVADNRERVAEAAIDNLEFAVDSLPQLETDRTFDVVYSAATLFFVEESAEAVVGMYERVNSGGHLIVNYPNDDTRETFDREFEGDKRDSFELVLEGRNLLTKKQIDTRCGSTPRDYWAAVDSGGDECASAAQPMVYVPK